MLGESRSAWSVSGGSVVVSWRCGLHMGRGAGVVAWDHTKIWVTMCTHVAWVETWCVCVCVCGVYCTVPMAGKDSLELSILCKRNLVHIIVY